MPTRAWYAAYASGYFEREIASEYSVEDKKSEHRTSAGRSGASGVTEVSGSVGSLGEAGERRGKTVMMICGQHGELRAQGRRHMTHPERLLAEEVRVPRPRPQPARHEAALRVRRRPADARAGPFGGVEHATALVRLERPLLVVRGELAREGEQRERGKRVVRRGERGVRLVRGDVCGDAEEEEDDVLDDGWVERSKLRSGN